MKNAAERRSRQSDARDAQEVREEERGTCILGDSEQTRKRENAGRESSECVQAEAQAQEVIETLREAQARADFQYEMGKEWRLRALEAERELKRLQEERDEALLVVERIAAFPLGMDTHEDHAYEAITLARTMLAARRKKNA